MGPDLNSPSYRSAVAGSPLQTMSSAGALSTPNLAAASPSSLTCSSGFHSEAHSSLYEAHVPPQRIARCLHFRLLRGTANRLSGSGKCWSG